MNQDEHFTVMTASEVAERLRVSRATVTRLAQRGELDRVPVRGRLCTAVRKPSSGAPAFVPARAA